MMTYTLARRGRTPLLRLALGALTALSLAACKVEDVLDIDDPDIIQPGSITSKEALPNALAGAIGDFQVAFSGGTFGNPVQTSEGVVQYGGLLGDELAITESFNTRIIIDRRANREDNSNNEAVYRSLARARVAAERTAAAYERLAGERANRPDTLAFANGRAEALALAGFTYILFAEHYCANGIPFAEIDDAGNIIPAPALSTDEVYRLAIQRFDQALQALSVTTGTSLTIARLARVGRARAYLNRANTLTSPFLDSAVAAIGGTAGVPTTFVYNINHSENSARENNGIFNFNQIQGRWTASNGSSRFAGCPAARVDPLEPGGIQYRNLYNPGTNPAAVWDVRTPVFFRGTASFDGSCIFSIEKYFSRSAPVPLAEGKEARLIEAEAALRKGDAAGWLAIHNALRATPGLNACPSTLSVGCVTPSPATLPPLVDPGTFDGRVTLHFQERALWLWVTGHRLGDMRRLVRQGFGRTVNQVFPSGQFIRTLAVGIYGTDVSMPVPFSERNNAEFSSASCVLTTP
ncbi:MAG TPA: hypothetical protein VJ672_00135 [Gemmatimonadaceae bacterium]|nr:hypothetical protein [Gemmatimonadaceae bacterium]